MSTAYLYGRYTAPDGSIGDVAVAVDENGRMLSRGPLDVPHIGGTNGALDAATAMEPWVFPMPGGARHGYLQVVVAKYGEASAGEVLAVATRYPLSGGGFSDWLPLPLESKPSHGTPGVLQVTGLAAGAEFKIDYTSGSTPLTKLRFTLFAFGG
ncbi:hypothetical protein [Methylomagnum sp.]